MTMDWEAAFFQQYQDACVGRLLRGIIHNLNGANQAFALQAALFKTMFAQADKLLVEAMESCFNPDCGVIPVRELLAKRAVMVEQMEDKVSTSQRIVNRILPLAQLYWNDQGEPMSLAAIVELEMEIMSADSFFKHKIDKRLDFPPDLPLLRRRCVEMHTMIHVLLDNAAYALRGAVAPWLSLSARCGDEALVVTVTDSGPGIDAEMATWVFEPFCSTRDGALGVGLFLAKKTAAAMGGRIEYSAADGQTSFTVTVPLQEVL